MSDKARRTLWIVSGGVEAVPGIEHAKKMGLHVVVSDGDPNAPGFAAADDRVVASTYDVGATVAAAERYHRSVRSIDGVMAVASDVPLTVASVAEALSLPGVPVESARLSADKLAMKRRLAERGVPIPWFSPVDDLAHLRSLVVERGLPLVLKPVDGRGARGVLLLSERVDLAWAERQARSQSPSARVMVEQYLPGPQVSTESVLLDGEAVTPGFSDRNYDRLAAFAPYFIEDGGDQPSRLAPSDRRAVSACAEDAARALGVTRGTAKGDMVLTAEGPKVIEMALRLSGGWLCTDQIPLATGVDLLGAAIRIALGDSLDAGSLRPAVQRGVAIRYFFPPPGRVAAVRNVDRFARAEGVHRLRVFVKPGDVLEPVTNHTRRAGFVITTGADREEAVARARAVVEGVAIETTPA